MTITSLPSSLPLIARDRRSVHLLSKAKAAKGPCAVHSGPCGCEGPYHASEAVEAPCGGSEGSLVGIQASGLTSDQILPLSERLERSPRVAQVRRGRDAFLLRLQEFEGISLIPGQQWLGVRGDDAGAYLQLQCSKHGQFNVPPNDVGRRRTGSGCAGCQYDVVSAATIARYRKAALSLIGERFGTLEVLDVEVGQYKHAGKKMGFTTTTFAFCKCECGREARVLANHLKSGHTQSCGRCQPRRRELERALDPKTAYETHFIYLGPVDPLADWHKLGVTNDIPRRERELGVHLLWQMRLPFGVAWVTEQVLLDGFYRHGFRRFSGYHIDPDEVAADLILQKQAKSGDHRAGLPRLVDNGLSEIIAGLPSAAICNVLRRVLKEVRYWGPERVILTLWPSKKGEVEKILGRTVEAAPATGFFLPERYLSDDDDDN